MLVRGVVRCGVVGLLFLLADLPAAGQGQPPAPGANCVSDEHRAFDFWLGSWVVTDPAGQRVGTNDLTRVASGCGMLESWVSARGTPGTSLNYYDPRDGRWHQHWTGSDGTILHLVGGIVDGRMVLSGERQSASGATVIDRVTWSREEGGRVRQFWESSSDGGSTWTVAFDGLYSRRSDTGGPG